MVETALPNSKGSMRRYADLLQAAFANDEQIEIQRVCVSKEWAFVPRKLATLAHHFACFRNAGRLVKEGADVFHVVDGSHGYLAKVLRRQHVVVTVHDVIPKLQAIGRFAVSPPGFMSKRIINAALTGLSFADHLIFDSTSTKKDCCAMSVRNRGTTSIIFPPLEPQLFRNNSNPELGDASPPYLFHIGNSGFYKNRAGVIRIFKKIATSVPHRLIMAGPSPSAQIQELVDEHNLGDRIDFRCEPSDNEVIKLYENASALVFPSLYEGFGWPPIEAMALGCPVVCSDGGSLREVVGNAALVSPVGDENAMAANLERILTDQSQSSRLIKRGLEHARLYTLERFAQQLKAVYLDVLER